ncbi:MAG: hypothetical protein WEB13_02215 [Dehalococcoidia bacterium]
MQQVTLAHRGAGGYARLRELRGEDEHAIAGAGTAAAIALLDRLLVTATGVAVTAGDAATLVAADRDRLLAALYRDAYGPRVHSTLVCARCGERFDLDFDIHDLLTSLGAAGDHDDGRSEAALAADGTVRFAGGWHMRLPTGADESAVAGLPPEEAAAELLARCTIAGTPPADREAIDDALEQLAPIAAVDLDATCPNCGEPQLAAFDLQSYLLGALRQEQRQLANEVHRLARAYGWSRTEILDMTRRERREHVDLIEAELMQRRQGVLA